MKALDKAIFERDQLKAKLEVLVGLLKEANESVGAAIGLELEYADYKSAEKLKKLKEKIEYEVKNCK